MFLDESAFDVDDGIPPVGNHGGNYQEHDLTVNLGLEDDMEELSMSSGGALNSAGGIGTSSASRARMLAQQRELQLKKRQTSASSGMVRSSIDKSENPSGFSVRQFSAPKAPQFMDEDDNDREAVRPGSTRSRGSNRSFARGDRDRDRDNDYLSPAKGRSSHDEWDRRERDSRDRADRGRDRGDWRDDRVRRGGRSRSPDFEDRRDRDRGREYDRDFGRTSRDRSDSRDRDRYGGRSRDRGHDRDRDRGRDRSDSRDGGRRGGRRGRGYSDDEDDDYYRSKRDRGDRKGGRSRDRSLSRDRDRGRDRDYGRDSRDRDRDRGRDHRRDRSRERDQSRGRKARGDRSDDEAQGYGSDRNDKWTSVGNGDRSMPVGSNRDRGHGERDRDRDKKDAKSSVNPNRPMQPADMDLTDMERFLTSPLPRGKGVVQCYIIRNKSGTNKLFPMYTLYLKEGDRFLMCSKKRANNKTSNYLISKAEGDLNKDSVNCLGKLRSNFVGTEFQVFDNGVNPNGDSYGSGATRRELACITYAPNVLGSRGPRKMQVAIPAVDENNTILAHEQSRSGDDDMLNRMKDRNLKDLCYLINKPPRWNEQVGAYVLNFSGRVTMASVKNFQLVDPDEQNAVVLQFGRVGKDQFTMDMQWPMSPFQAFAITMSSFDSKIACD